MVEVFGGGSNIGKSNPETYIVGQDHKVKNRDMLPNHFWYEGRWGKFFPRIPQVSACLNMQVDSCSTSGLYIRSQT